ncbi:hypothetical protein D3C72_764790 [compost metagenome]
MVCFTDFENFGTASRLFLVELVARKPQNFKPLSLPAFVQLLQISELTGITAAAGSINDKKHSSAVPGQGNRFSPN